MGVTVVGMWVRGKGAQLTAGGWIGAGKWSKKWIVHC